MSRLNIRAEVEAQRAKQAEKSSQKKAELKDLFSSVFESESGRKAFKNLSTFAKCGTDMFYECKDDREFSYISGRQSIMLHILKILED